MTTAAVRRGYGRDEHLRRRTFLGLAWTAGSRVVQQTLYIAVTAVLARLLVPSDFGLVSLVAIFAGFAALFTDLGLGAALVQRKAVEERHLSSAFWLNVGVATVLAIVICALAPAIAAFFDQPRLVWMTVAMAVTFPVMALAVVQGALVQRAMNFRRLAGIENVATVVGGAVAVAAALAGLGVWSLVLLTVGATVTRTVVLWATSDWQPSRRFSLSAARELWGFSANLLGFQTINYWIRNADNLVIGKVVGPASLGIYGRAYNLMLQPSAQVNFVTTRVMFPALARLQDQPQRVRRAYLRALSLIGLVSFPLAIGLLVAAEPLILSLYGEKWQEVVPILQILCVAALIQPLSTTVGWIYQSQGRTDWMFRWGLIAGSVTIGSILLGVQWGVIGVAVAYAVRTVILAPFTFAIPGRLIGLRLAEVGRATARALAAACGMGVVVWIASRPVSEDLAPWALLLVEVGIGLASYAGLLFILRPPGLADLGALVQTRLRSSVEGTQTRTTNDHGGPTDGACLREPQALASSLTSGVAPPGWPRRQR